MSAGLWVLTREIPSLSTLRSDGGCVKPKDRQARILDIVRRDDEASVEALAKRFDVSHETVRRDLRVLASTGLLHKVRGGARPTQMTVEGSHRERLFAHAEAKTEIGAKLAGCIGNGDTLFIDTGTTTLACAKALSTLRNLTIITNSIRLAQRLSELSDNHTVFMLGGTYGADNAQTLGPLATEQAGRFQADHAVLTVAAIDAESGAMDADFDEAQVARAMIGNAQRTILLADASKFGQRAAHRVCRLADVDMLVSDQAPEGTLATALSAWGVEVR